MNKSSHHFPEIDTSEFRHPIPDPIHYLRPEEISSTKISRRKFLKMTGTLAAGLALGACAPKVTGTGIHPGDNVQLVYQDCRCRGEQLMLQQFHDKHPNIQVFYTPDPENFEETMLADMEAGTAPDVLAGCCDFFPIWAQKGYLLDLKPYVQADLDSETIEDWDPAQYHSFFSRDGIQYALPKYHGALALIYNKDWFDRLKLDHPDRTWSHDDYQVAMRLLSQDKDRDGKIDLWGSMLDVSWERLQVHINGWGGHIVNPEDPTSSWIDKPESLEAMEWIRARMWDDHFMANKLDVQNNEPRQAFIQQRIAMVEEGSWALKDILDGARFRIGVAPFPAGPQRRVTLATTDGFAIYSGTKHPEAAWELLKFLVSPEYGRAMAQTQLLQPARASLIEEWVGFIHNEYPAQSREIDLAAFAEGHIEGYSVTAEVFANMSDAQRILKAAWEQIFTLGQVPVDVLKDISDQVEKAQLA